MTDKSSPANLFLKNFRKPQLLNLFEEFIANSTSVGRDGVSVKLFSNHLDHELEIIHRKVNVCTYEFTAYREKLISKGASKPPRLISIPTVRDKLVLKFLSKLLAEVYPEHVSHVPHTKIKKVHEVSANRATTDLYLKLDIQGFFPSINHKILMRVLRRRIRKRQIVHLVENIITTPTGIKKSDDTLNKCGIPQGLSVSNTLSSLYLSDIDEVLKEIPNVDYFRFVDDILLIGSPTAIKELAKTVPALLKSKRKVECYEVGKD